MTQKFQPGDYVISHGGHFIKLILKYCPYYKREVGCRYYEITEVMCFGKREPFYRCICNQDWLEENYRVLNDEEKSRLV